MWWFWDKRIRLSLLLSAFFSVLFCFYYVDKNQQQDSMFSFDALCSDAVKIAIEKKTQALLERDGFSSALLTVIKDEFQCIKSLSVVKRADRKLHFIVTVYKPLVLLNNTMVLLSSGVCVDRACIQCENQHLFSMQVDPSVIKQTMPVLADSVLIIPDAIFNHFLVEWQDDATVVLHAKDRNIHIMANIESINDQEKIQHCYAIYEKTSNKKPFWVDIRFKNQIIVKDEKRGRNEESIC